ncbi:NACHT domain-containing protein [Kitasatospora sp. NPDC051853]|uniref:NACHT domain-containing protein n=1 Tax=Kitasatospora sp. NPDC051853 TaxID=3364058 RepID=UPI00379C65B1
MRRVRRETHRRVAPTQKWRRRWTPGTWAWLLAVLGSVLFAGWLAMAVHVIVDGEPGFVERTCRSTGQSCGAVISFSTPFLALSFSTLVFLAVRRWRIVRPVRRTAKRTPRDLVPTAGSVMEEVVGRQELCSVIAQALRDRRSRRPYILVGGVGSGKTAVLVQLTQLLAEKGAVPVPVHLRGADLDRDDFNFGELAKRRFCDEVDPGVLSRAQAERVWRQICMDDKAVVIADGLEEAFIEGEEQWNRDSVIRRAIRRAEKQRLPLVIASRPHAALEGTQAAVIELEPLSEEAALLYLEQNDPGVDRRRLDWIVETAGVAESPLYLQIARQLRNHQLLEHFENAKEWDQIETRGSDRAGIRVSLLESWSKALVEGHLRAQFDITEEERRDTVAVISALACVGLLSDRLEVRFDELDVPGRPAPAGTPGRPEPPGAPGGPVLAALRERVPGLPEDGEQGCWSTRLARYAAQGEQLGLVEAHSSKVRFPHSLLQAFLGSHLLDAVQRSAPAALTKALEEPGRELLIALIMRSRFRSAGTAQAPTVRLLLDAARNRQDDKALDLYAAALEIDSGRRDDSAHEEIAATVLGRWPEITAGDRRAREEAKLRLVHRFGEALRRIDRERRPRPEEWVLPAYGQFMRISWIEPGYPVRLAIAQEIGAGGDCAFDALRELFPWPTERDDPKAAEYDPWEQYRKAVAEREHRAGSEREQRIAHPEEAVPALAPETGRTETGRTELWRQFVTRAWLVPMIVGSVGSDRRAQALERMDLWLEHLTPNASTGRADLPVSLEIALAQGFKSAANRRRRHPAISGAAREHLIERAEFMLAHARYWYSQLTLIHALCLWELPDSTDDGPAGSGAPAGGGRGGGDPFQAVERWLTLAGSEQAPADRPADELTPEGLRRLHPFVAEAGDLAALALETGHPERFVWIDEKGATVNIGSSAADPALYRKHNLWVPPSVGWSTLHPRAQQLLADVLLLLNLTERDGLLADERLARTNRTTLPPCLTTDRRPLRPELTVGMPGTTEPGTECLRDCRFELCPYPAKGEQPGAELREPFCRQQQALLRSGPLHRRTAPWQGMARRELDRFWAAMAERTRTPKV